MVTDRVQVTDRGVGSLELRDALRQWRGVNIVCLSEREWEGRTKSSERAGEDGDSVMTGLSAIS